MVVLPSEPGLQREELAQGCGKCNFRVGLESPASSQVGERLEDKGEVGEVGKPSVPAECAPDETEISEPDGVVLPRESVTQFHGPAFFFCSDPVPESCIRAVALEQILKPVSPDPRTPE